jgi:hypothetical protein
MLGGRRRLTVLNHDQWKGTPRNSWQGKFDAVLKLS